MHPTSTYRPSKPEKTTPTETTLRTAWLFGNALCAHERVVEIPDNRVMDADAIAWVIAELRHSLQALALPADEQLALFPDFVCKADELALDLDNFYPAARLNVPDLFTQEQWDRVDVIDCMLGAMSGRENAERWTDDALRTSPEWETIRGLARTALEGLGWEVAVPPSFADRGTTFIGGGREIDPAERS